MTQKELETAFSTFMPGNYGSRLAALLCQPETVPQTVDGMDKTLFPEDGKRFNEDEGFRPRTARSVAEQHVYDYYYGSDLRSECPAAPSSIAGCETCSKRGCLTKAVHCAPSAKTATLTRKLPLPSARCRKLFPAIPVPWPNAT